ncbi:hypothetical protein [uncultured Kordia sp.]|uniref:hypothetical protein n=1 Tax=uncultured Kordia sp. TaxID=507699 RepID=UPI002624A796|nr:hypothetical protein [uncultured Kordia sp.]
MKIATNIPTTIWYEIIEFLKTSGWDIVTTYEQFDKGIDFDLYEFKKEEESILCAWDNWFEGEIKGEERFLKTLEKEFQITFKYDTPKHLGIDILEKLKSILPKKNKA